jgi:hypothetical protein
MLSRVIEDAKRFFLILVKKIIRDGKAGSLKMLIQGRSAVPLGFPPLQVPDTRGPISNRTHMSV